MDYLNFHPDHERILLVGDSISGPFDIYYEDELIGSVQKYDYQVIVEEITIAWRKKWMVGLVAERWATPKLTWTPPVKEEEPEEVFGAGIV
jgi:hypothetical protein